MTLRLCDLLVSPYGLARYMHKKHDGNLPLIGVNTMLPKDHGWDVVTDIELIRSTEGEKDQQIDNIANHQRLRNIEGGLGYLQKPCGSCQCVRCADGAVKSYSLGWIPNAL